MRFKRTDGGRAGRRLFSHVTEEGGTMTCWASTVQEAVWRMRKLDPGACKANVSQVSFDSCEVVAVFTD